MGPDLDRRDPARRGRAEDADGIEAQKRMDEGLLVPDDVMIALVRERSSEADAAVGFVLDGFPRTVPQADALDSMLQSRGQRLDIAVRLTVPRGGAGAPARSATGVSGVQAGVQPGYGGAPDGRHLRRSIRT
jgi:adenylate kinase family enzyme